MDAEVAATGPTGCRSANRLSPEGDNAMEAMRRSAERMRRLMGEIAHSEFLDRRVRDRCAAEGLHICAGFVFGTCAEPVPNVGEPGVPPMWREYCTRCRHALRRLGRESGIPMPLTYRQGLP